jgi:hypothetical protein
VMLLESKVGARCKGPPSLQAGDGKILKLVLSSHSCTHTYTFNLLTTRPYLATFLETAAFKLLLPSINSSTKHPTGIPSHRNLQFKSWLSNSRARRPSCSTRRRSMPQRLLPMRKRTARTASTLAADLRRPVAIPRDTVSLSLSAAVALFFSICPSTAERGFLQMQTLLLLYASFIHCAVCLRSSTLSHFTPFLPAAQPARMQYTPLRPTTTHEANDSSRSHLSTRSLQWLTRRLPLLQAPRHSLSHHLPSHSSSPSSTSPSPPTTRTPSA